MCAGMFVMLVLYSYISLIGWISDTLSQGYTDLQSFFIYLDSEFNIFEVHIACKAM